MDVEVEQRSVRGGDVRLNVATAGAGRPVLLLHGFGVGSRRELIAALTQPR